MQFDKTPNLFIVGAAKGGTTTIYRLLQLHPEVFLSDPKEPCFMAYHGFENDFNVHAHAITDIESYKNLFIVSNHKYRGEASAIYLHLYENTIKNLIRYTDSENLRIIMLLRDPAERAYSQYLMHVRDLKEDLTFAQALESEDQRKQGKFNIDFYYKERGFYSAQVKAYLDAFENVKVLLYDDLQKNPQGVFDEICAFLEIEKRAIDTNKKFNVSGVPKSKNLMRIKDSLLYKDNIIKKTAKFILPQKVRRKVSRGINESVNQMNVEKVDKPYEEINSLKELYHEDICKLETIINRNLSNWKK